METRRIREASRSSLDITVEGGREADPLPTKVGEIGFVPGTGLPSLGYNAASREDIVLPARHPADRDHVDQEQQPQENESNEEVPSSGRDADTASSTAKKSILKTQKLGGVHVLTFFRIILIILFLAGTGVAWWLTINKFSGQDQSFTFGDSQNQSNDQNEDDDKDGTDDYGSSGGFPFSSIVFVHVAFAVITIFELIFLERAIFHARAERYIFVNGLTSRALANASMGIAPWNRPALPTYAHALAESGVGTGDVEDNMIAINPPPAYGNTRDSTLILSNLLPASLLRTLSRTSERSERSRRSSVSGSRRSPEAQMEEGSMSSVSRQSLGVAMGSIASSSSASLPPVPANQEVPLGRPLSYGASEEVQDAERARVLETTLASASGGKDGFDVVDLGENAQNKVNGGLTHSQTPKPSSHLP